MLAVLLLVALAAVPQLPGVLGIAGYRVALPPAQLASCDDREEPAVTETILAPAMHAAVRTARETGSWPSWNAHARFGEPFRAASGAPVGYLPFWLLGLLPVGPGHALVTFLHAALACVLCFRLLRVLSLSRYSAFVGAGIYALGWYATCAAGRLPELAAAAWLPLAIECAWRCLFSTRRPLPAIGLGMALGIAFLTGGTATASLGALLAVAMIVFGLSAIDRTERTAALGTALLGLAVAALLTAPLWLDAWMHAAVLRQPAEPPVRRLQPAAALLALLAPGVFGEAGGVAPPEGLRALAPRADGLESALYPGVLALLVAVLGTLRPKRSAMSLFWLGALGLGLLLAVDGPVGDAVAWATSAAPHRPGASLALFHLAVAVLVGFALEGFLDAPGQRAFAVPVTAWLVLSSVALLALSLLPPLQLAREPIARLLGTDDPALLDPVIARLRVCAIAPAAGLTILAGLLLAWRRLGILRLKTAIGAVALAELIAIGVLFASRAPVPCDDGDRSARLPTDGTRVVTLASAEPVPGGWLALRDVATIDGHGDAILERSARYLELLEAGSVRVGARASVRPPRSAAAFRSVLAKRAAIAAVVADRPDVGRSTPAIGAAPLTETAPLGPPGSPLAAPPSAPRVRLAFRAIEVDDADAAERALRLGEARTLDDVVVERPPLGFEPLRPATDANAELVRDRGDTVIVRADLGPGRGYLVLADALAPGWTVRVDGEPAPLLAADLAFRAVPLREGRHVVEFRYRPLGQRLGLPLALLGVALMAALGVVVARRAR
ncbi:MAG: hypothetical protein IPM29_16955 [Planctomycetes bacterium]|nr:hypothetical protein [Planctomycetota bacterium]